MGDAANPHALGLYSGPLYRAMMLSAAHSALTVDCRAILRDWDDCPSIMISPGAS